MKIRKSLAASIVLLLSFLWGCRGPINDQSASDPQSRPGTSSLDCGPESQFIPSEPEMRAVSLRALQERLRACQRDGTPSQELLQLAGLKKINGLVVDDEHRDLILMGVADETSPPLHLEDLVVALRNAWHKYTFKEGNTSYYSAPGCSIDPDPRVLEELQLLGQKIFSRSASQEMESHIQDWQRICQQSQSVRVLGIPFDTHFAHVMVTADYDMKRVVDGTDSLDLPEFASLTEMTLKKVKEESAMGQPVSVPLTSLNRFWFSPGENEFQQAPGIVLIKRSQVALLTEQEYLDKQGQIVGQGKPGVLGQQFARKFTTRYVEVAQQRQIYSELEHLFRFVALANILQFQPLHTQAGLDLSYLLEDYVVVETPVARQLPGRAAVKEDESRRNVPGGYQVAHFWLPSCGGVVIDIKAQAEQFKPDTLGDLSRQKAAVLSQRPAGQGLYWKVRAGNDFNLVRRNRESNLLNEHLRVYAVRQSPSGYVVYGENEAPLYEGPLSTGTDGTLETEVVKLINEELPANAGMTIYLRTEGFSSEDKVAGFLFNCRLKQYQRNQKINIRPLNVPEGAPRLADAYLNPGYELEGPPEVKPLDEGQRESRYSVNFNVVRRIGQTISRYSVEIITKSKQIALAIQQRIMAFFTGHIVHEVDSFADTLNSLLLELKLQHGLKDEDVEIKFRDQFGNTLLGALAGADQTAC